jgi:hypothetical protein
VQRRPRSYRSFACLIAWAALSLSSSRVSAQASASFDKPAPPPEQLSWALSYELAFPAGDLHDFVGNPSPLGAGLDIEWPVVEGLRLGLAAHFSQFYDVHPHTTRVFDWGAITGTLYRYLDVWTGAFLARYRFLRPDAPLRPFLGAEFGVAFLNATTFLADAKFDDAPHGLLFAGELGALVRMSKSFQAVFALRYNLTTAALAEASRPSYLSLQLGVVWEDAQ